MTGFLRAAIWSGRDRCFSSEDLLDRAGSIAAIALLLALTASIWLQSDAAPDRAAAAASRGAEVARSAPARDMMIGAYGGAPYTYPSDVHMTKPPSHDFTAKDVQWRGEPFKSPIYYGVRIIRWLGGGATGAMLDFTHSKTIAELKKEASFSGTIDNAPAPAKAVLGDVFRRLEFSHGHNMLTLNGVLRLPSLLPRLSPYIGAGAGISLPHTEVQVRDAPARTYEYQYTGPAAQALLGLEVRVGRMSYFIEYKFTFARYEAPLTYRDGTVLFGDLWQQFKRWISGEPPPGGYVTTLLSSHQLIAGLGVRTAGAAPAGGN